MPEITAALIAFIAGSVAVGAVVGWISRSKRCVQEKNAVNEGWQRQLEAQRAEHARLVDQNRTLMEQISQLQASGKDATNRARELSDALKEAFERRDQLQRQLKEIRSNLERAVRQRDELQSEMKSNEARDDSTQAALKDKDDKIFRLSRELENWQNRLPPLIERFRERDGEARELEAALAEARARIDELESAPGTSETRIEPVDQEALGKELDASNDPANVTYTGIEKILQQADDASEDDIDAVDEIDVVAEEALDDVAGEDELADESEVVAEYAPEDEAAEEPKGDSRDEPDDELRDERYDDIDEEPATADVAELHGREAGGLRDNLRLIKGIGPAIEKTLNELGIFRYHQIAEMTEYDINRVAQRLKGFSSRIYREDWIGQARDLQLKKSGT
jgi:predicted flap endonuclease-1-like 5' DNA nuclease